MRNKVTGHKDRITPRHHDGDGMGGEMVSPSISAGAQSPLKPRDRLRNKGVDAGTGVCREESKSESLEHLSPSARTAY
jgi:hypothetical protein